MVKGSVLIGLHGELLIRHAQAAIEAGQVILPERKPWLDEFKAEIMAFPNGRFDDQVDSVSQFLGWAEGRKRNQITSSTNIGMY